jgi:hypothetical protein
MFCMNESGTSVGTEQMLALRVSAAIPAPIRQRGEPTDPHRGPRASPRAPVVEALGHARVPIAGCRPDHRGGSRPCSTRIVQRERRPTSNVDSMMVLGARR